MPGLTRVAGVFEVWGVGFDFGSHCVANRQLLLPGILKVPRWDSACLLTLKDARTTSMGHLLERPLRQMRINRHARRRVLGSSSMLASLKAKLSKGVNAKLEIPASQS